MSLPPEEKRKRRKNVVYSHTLFSSNKKKKVLLHNALHSASSALDQVRKMPHVTFFAGEDANYNESCGLWWIFFLCPHFHYIK